MKKTALKKILNNVADVVIIYFLTTLLAYVFDIYNVHSENLLMIYLLGILIIVMQTKSFTATVISSVVFILTHDFLFIEPRHIFSKYGGNFLVSATVFLLVALIVNLLVVRLQKQILHSSRSADLHEKLYKATEKLISIHEREQIIAYADCALTELTGSSVEFFFDIDKDEKNEAKKWCYKNSARCGNGEVEFPDAGCKYLPVKSNKKTVGVVSIDCTKNEVSEEALECVTALLSQITMAIERAELEEARRTDSKFYVRSNLKTSVTRNISHNMYPKAQSVLKNSKYLRENFNLLDNEDIIKTLKEIEEDSDYITQTIDNLLNINQDR